MSGARPPSPLHPLQFDPEDDQEHRDARLGEELHRARHREREIPAVVGHDERATTAHTVGHLGEPEQRRPHAGSAQRRDEHADRVGEHRRRHEEEAGLSEPCVAEREVVDRESDVRRVGQHHHQHRGRGHRARQPHGAGDEKRHASQDEQHREREGPPSFPCPPTEGGYPEGPGRRGRARRRGSRCGPATAPAPSRGRRARSPPPRRGSPGRRLSTKSRSMPRPYIPPMAARAAA